VNVPLFVRRMIVMQLAIKCSSPYVIFDGTGAISQLCCYVYDVNDLPVQ